MTSTQVQIFKNPGDDARRRIADVFLLTGSGPFEGLQSYEQYYTDEVVKQLRFGIPSQHQTAQLALKTHEDVLEVVQLLRDHGDETRPAMRSLINQQRTEQADDKCLNRAIDVSLRLWLMINVREEKFKSASPLKRPCLEWDDETPLKDFLHELFPKERWQLTTREGRYDPLFTAAFMSKICGLKIDWTTSLEDHLRLERKSDGSQTLWVFPYKTYVRCLGQDEKCLGMGAAGRLLPPGLLQETIDSLLLLFPARDAETQKLLKRHRQEFIDHEPYLPVRPLGILDFHHWRDRLLELHQEVYQVQTPGWRQLRLDPRNPQQLLAFWLAIVIAVLTVISTAAGVFSAVAAGIQVWASQAPAPTCSCYTTGSN